MNRSKLQTTHLHRNAYVYIRQSTRHQVQYHLESQQRQYELTRLASELGYGDDRIILIDEDLGISASGRDQRTGFERLVSDVALGRAGIVLGLEVSRLARNNRDWYELLDLCAIKDTLIGDADGIYDPAAYNDRLLLGLKGTMSEAELHILKGRMLAGLKHKAEKGELRFRLPAGYEFDHDGAILRTSDEQIAHFVELVFAKMFELRSVSGVTKYLLHEGLLIPRREFRGGGSMRWELPYYRAVYLMLTNPIYAGTYVYGRSRITTEVDATGSRTTRRRAKAMAEWDVILHDHHASYISRDNFQRIQAMIERNRPAARDQASAALREGSALLQGILRCGRCGRSMTVRYHGGPGKSSAAYYGCLAAHVQRRAGVCQSMGGRRIDQAVVSIFLEAMAEGQVEIELAALRKLDNCDDGAMQQMELQLERARYEAGRAERQFNAVEPENRVVARTLESRWNAALANVEQLERQLEERRRQLALRLTEEEEKNLRALTRNLPQLWTHESVTNKDRKALIRAVVEEVQLRKEERLVSTRVIWKGGAVTERTVALHRLAPPSPTPPDLVELIRELATRHTDAQIARVLVRRGIKTPKKRLSFTAHHVQGLRRSYGIAACAEPVAADRGDTYTVQQTAKLFSVSTATVYIWLERGVLTGEQVAPGAPWAIRVSQTDRERLAGTAPPGWVTLKKAAAELGVSRQTVLNWVKAAKIPYIHATNGKRRGLRIDVKSAPARKQGQLLD